MIVARLTEKGGAGKTIPATNLAGMRAMRSHRVLLVDADRQGSLHYWVESQVGLPLMRVESEVIHGEALGRRLRNPGTRYEAPSLTPEPVTASRWRRRMRRPTTRPHSFSHPVSTSPPWAWWTVV